MKRALILLIVLLALVFGLYWMYEQFMRLPEDIEAPVDMAPVVEADRPLYPEDRRADPIDPSSMSGLLPDKIGDIKLSGERQLERPAFGLNITRTHGIYQTPDGKDFTISVSDNGGMAGMSHASREILELAGTRKDTEFGYAEYLKIGGHPAIAKYKERNNNSEVQVIVNGRFVVYAGGDDMDLKTLKKAVKSINFGSLKQLDVATSETN